MKHTIVIFGGAGFIGTNITLEALARGHTVIIFDSLIRKGTEENIKILEGKVEYIRGDIRNPEDFNRIPSSVTACINLAANPGIPWSLENPLYDFRINALGALHILEFARTHGKIPVIFASTNKIYTDEVNNLPIEEKKNRYEWTDKNYSGVPITFPMDGRGEYPHSPYGCSKASADLYHQEYYHAFGVPTVINRMSCIYGLYQKGVADQGWVDHFVRIIVLGNGHIDIFGDGKQVRDMLWGGDVAKLYIDELEQIKKSKGNVFNVGGGKENTISLKESIELIENLTGKKAKLTFHDWRHADQKVYITDISKVTNIMKWTPLITPEQGIEKMIKAYGGLKKVRQKLNLKKINKRTSQVIS